jgi:hypothetical protein
LLDNISQKFIIHFVRVVRCPYLQGIEQGGSRGTTHSHAATQPELPGFAPSIEESD